MYRGREGQWAFYLHRISGLGIVVFLMLHVANISSAMWGPEVSNALMKFYHQRVSGGAPPPHRRGALPRV